MGEFELIRRYFSDLGRAAGVVLGVGDDAAVLDVPPGQQLVMATDTLVEGRHFLPEADPADVGWKSLAVNLSDLAAMGAQPRWFILALTVPEADESWLGRFAAGLSECAQTYGVQLVGGDTTRGPLSITITAAGLVPHGQAITRHGAKPGHTIFLSGPVGLAAAGLPLARAGSGHDPDCVLLKALNRPRPAVSQGMAVRGRASAMLDVSDGLLQDLAHLLQAGGLGAAIDVDNLPGRDRLADYSGQARAQWQLGGGDDYVLLATAPESVLAGFTQIGKVTAGGGVVDVENGQPLQVPGFDHFSTDQ